MASTHIYGKSLISSGVKIRFGKFVCHFSGLFLAGVKIRSEKFVRDFQVRFYSSKLNLVSCSVAASFYIRLDNWCYLVIRCGSRFLSLKYLLGYLIVHALFFHTGKVLRFFILRGQLFI